jgi:hypothetical protein
VDDQEAMSMTPNRKKIDDTSRKPKDSLVVLLQKLASFGVRIAPAAGHEGVEILHEGVGTPRRLLADLRRRERRVYDLIDGTPIISCARHGECTRLPRDPGTWSAEQRTSYPWLHARMTAGHALLTPNAVRS